MIASLLSFVVCSTSNGVSDANLSLQHTSCVSIMAESASSVLCLLLCCLGLLLLIVLSPSLAVFIAAVQFALSSVKQQASYLIVIAVALLYNM